VSIGVVWQEIEETLRLGCQVLDIDGVDCLSFDECDLIKMNPLEGRDKINLTYMTEDKEKRKLTVYRVNCPTFSFDVLQFSESDL